MTELLAEAQLLALVVGTNLIAVEDVGPLRQTLEGQLEELQKLIGEQAIEIRFF